MTMQLWRCPKCGHEVVALAISVLCPQHHVMQLVEEKPVETTTKGRRA